MLINRLILNNFGLHRQLELELGPGINGIIGSNGSGKSTIVQALRFAITGGYDKRSSSKLDNLRYGADTGWAEVQFSHAFTDVTIRRSVDRNSQKLDTDSETLTKVVDIDRYLTSLLGVNLKSLEANVFAYQGEIDAILDSTETERMREIQRTVGLDRSEEIYKLLGNEISKIQITVGLETQLQETSELLKSARMELELLQLQLQTTETQIQALLPTKQRWDAIQQVMAESAARNACKVNIDALQVELTNLQAALDTNINSQKAVDTLLLPLRTVAKEANVKLLAVEAGKKLINTIAELTKQLAQIQAAKSASKVISEDELKAASDKLVEAGAKLHRLSAYLSGKEARPKLPEELALEAKLAEVYQTLASVGNEFKASKKVEELAYELKSVEAKLKLMAGGVCPTCGSECKCKSESLEQARIALEAEISDLIDTERNEWQAALALNNAKEQVLNEKLTKLRTAAEDALKHAKRQQEETVHTCEREYAQLRVLADTWNGLCQREKLVSLQLTNINADGYLPTAEEISQWRETVANANRLEQQTSSLVTIIASQKAEIDRTAKQMQQLVSSYAKFIKIPDPTAEELQTLQTGLQNLSALTNSRTATMETAAMVEARIRQYEGSCNRLAEQWQREKKDTAWLKLCQKLRDVFHVSEFPAKVMREYAQILNKRISYYLELWQAPFSMQLNNDLQFDVEYEDGKKHAASRLSGGRRVVAAVAFRLAMIDTFAKNLGLLVLDEPSVYLDTDNIIHLQQLLVKLKELVGHSGCQIILITHEERLMDFFDNVIHLPPQD